jgi:tetratricopeptide (TPR) repeat protein
MASLSADVPGGQGVQVSGHGVQVNVFGDNSPADVMVVVGSIPQAPPAFRPRPELLGELGVAGPGVPVIRVVTGMRGVGKTQVAAAYARGCVDDRWRLVAWINAEDTAAAVSSLALVAYQLKLVQRGTGAEALSPEVSGQLVRSRLEADGDRCLLVFDNVTDIAALRDYLPAAGQSRVVITSAIVGAASLGRPVPVDVFSQPESLAFLAERTGLADVDGAGKLAAELGHLPLALSQAAAVIAAEYLSYDVYLDRLHAFTLEDYLIPPEGDPYAHGVAQTILLSIHTVTAADTTGLSGDLLDLIAMLSPAPVSRSVLHSAGSSSALTGPAGHAAIDNALARLAGASLLSYSSDRTRVSAHRLVTRVARERRERQGTLADLAATACAFLATVISALDEPWKERLATGDAIAQIIALNEHFAPRTDDGQVAKDLLALRGWALWCLNEFGDSPAQAIEVGESLLADYTRIQGRTHPDTLMSGNNLASAYRAAGRLEAAITLYEEVLAERVQVLGDAHPDTLVSRNNLAAAYRLAGRLAEALPMLEQVLADRVRFLGEAHPDTLVSRSNLASAYREAGHLDKATPLLEQVLADRLRFLGDTHPDTLMSRNDVGGAYLAEGRTEEAIAVLELVCADRERILGKTHPQTLMSRNDLAQSYRAAGRLDRAIPILQQALADRMQVLGEEHPDTLISRNNLASAYRATGDLDKAIPLYAQALTGLERVLGNEHPTTAVVRKNLAGARQQKRAND